MKNTKVQGVFHQRQDFAVQTKFSRTSHDTAFQDPTADTGWSATADFSGMLFKMRVVEGNPASSAFISFYRTPAILYFLIQ